MLFVLCLAVGARAAAADTSPHSTPVEHDFRFLAVKSNAGKDVPCKDGEEEQCLEWCSPGAAQTHCHLCTCQDCSFCMALSTLHSVAACVQHDERDSESLMCLNWCDASVHTRARRPHLALTQPCMLPSAHALT